MATLTQVLADVLALRGVLAAAVVSVDGEILAGAASDTALLDRMTGAVTGALAAGEALSGLVTKSLIGAREEQREADDDAGDDGFAEAHGTALGDSSSHAGGRQLMIIYEDSGPIVFTPLPGGERVAVVALNSSHDLGRARYQLRGFTSSLANADVPLG